MKKIKIWFVLLFFTSLFLLTNCHSKLPEITNLNQGSGNTVIALGDSITTGYGLNSEDAYPSLLSREFGFPILNRGVNGDTTEEALQRLEKDVLSQSPWLVIVALGGNDFLKKVPKTETKQNLESIVNKIHNRGAIVVLLGMNLGLFQDEYQEIYQNIANDTGCYLIPQILKGIIDNPNHRQQDIIHPNKIGQELLANKIIQALNLLLEKATWPPDLLKFRQ